MPFNLKDVTPIKRLFHNEEIDVYPTTTTINEIKFWYENARNLLDFEDIERIHKKPIGNIDEKIIIEYLASPESGLQLQELKKSILLNGVRVPLIVHKDMRLLDGNRRYFACKLIQFEAESKKRSLPSILTSIPVHVITEAITSIQEKKILAEANFVPDYKVPWTPDVKAKVVCDYYDDCKNEGISEKEIYTRIFDVYSIGKAEAQDYLETREFVNEFILIASEPDNEISLRRIVQKKYLYFYEFKNKISSGKSAIKDIPRRDEVKGLFFYMMQEDRIKNFKQIEPLIRARNDPFLWDMLISSKGIKMDQVEALDKERRAIRSIEDKLRNFNQWVEANLLVEGMVLEISGASRELIGKLLASFKQLAAKISGRQ
jgi:hypothetical protein